MSDSQKTCQQLRRDPADPVVAVLLPPIDVHGDLASLHEAYAVLTEEVDELWELVRQRRSDRDPPLELSEAIDIAAVHQFVAAAKSAPMPTIGSAHARDAAPAARQTDPAQLRTEYFEGAWRLPTEGGPDPWAVITYSEEPSPETGHVGWCWWALGAMGDAASYEEACDAASEAIQRRMVPRMAPPEERPTEPPDPVVVPPEGSAIPLQRIPPFKELMRQPACPEGSKSAPPDRDARLSATCEEIVDSALRAIEDDGDFASLHEAWAILADYADELWASVRLDGQKRSPIAVRREAIDIAVVALRIAVQFGAA